MSLLECTLGHFGVACRERCSEYCINNGPCDHVSGACSGGCQDGYFGARCFNCKKLTYLSINDVLNILLSLLTKNICDF